MEVAKSESKRRKSQAIYHSSKQNESLKKAISVTREEISQVRVKGKSEKVNNKRENSEKNDEAITRQKQLKPEKSQANDKIIASRKTHSLKRDKDQVQIHPTLNGEKSVLCSDVNKPPRSKPHLCCKPKVDEREKRPEVTSGRKEKSQAKAVVKRDQGKRKLVDNENSREKSTGQHQFVVEPTSKEKDKVKRQISCPSPEKRRKDEKEEKNTKIQRSSNVDAVRKKASGKLSAKKSKCAEKVIKSPTAVPEINADDPMAMLMMMEGCQSKQQNISAHHFGSQTNALQTEFGSSENEHSDKSQCLEENTEEMDDSDNTDLSDMEDVKDHTLPVEEERSQIPTEPVQITLDLPDFIKKKRKKKEFDWKKHLEKQVRKFKKEVAINIHKTHILCLIAHGLRQNNILNDETVKGLCLSLVPSHLIKSATTCLSTERVVDSAVSWYKITFPLDKVSHASDSKLISVDAIVTVLSKNLIKDARIWVYIFIVILRSLGLSVRLVLSLQPIPFKVSESAGASSSSSKAHGSSKGNAKTTSKTSTSKLKPKGQSASSSMSPSQKLSTSLSSTKSSSLLSPSSSSSSSKQSVAKPSSTKSSMKSSSSSKSTSSTKTNESSTPRISQSKRRSSLDARMKTKKDLKEESEYEDEFDDQSDSSSDERGKQGKQLKKKKGNDAVKKTKPCNVEEENSDSDFEATSPYFGRCQKELKVKSNRKVLSEDDEDESQYGRGHDFWIEIFMEDKKKWTCFDCFKSVYNKPYRFEIRATQPVCYVIGIRNDNGVKDVTARYTKQWFSQTRKIRVDADWLEQTFGVLSKASYEESVMEEDQIKSQLMVRPMPSSITEFKNHPLYALRRHLLKFEAIYPDTAIPLGYIRKEPIYARECVRTLHSRDNWLKEGRLVRLKEEPYKMVKSRPKWNKPKENPDELDLELYGEWQTELYIPPPAFNGKVPKNEYGNVELFQPWMLPTGTVQLKIQGLQRVARKLNIDVAPAMVGWDHHGGHAHPIFDGVIVCEEFADALLDAWDEDQEIQKQKEDEKQEKRVYGNWRLLIRGLLIKERLKNKFLQDAPLMESGESECTSSVTKSSAAGPCDERESQKIQAAGTGVKRAVVEKADNDEKNKSAPPNAISDIAECNEGKEDCLSTKNDEGDKEDNSKGLGTDDVTSIPSARKEKIKRSKKDIIQVDAGVDGDLVKKQRSTRLSRSSGNKKIK